MQDKYVLITGGTGGLGGTVTCMVLEAGAAGVTLPYRSQKSVDELKIELTPEAFRRLQLVTADLNDENQVETMVNAMPRTDALIHLVGGFQMGATDEFSFSDWQKQLDQNLNNTFLLCKHCLRRMRGQGYGRIVTVGSRGAVQPGANLAAYSASKAGVVALTQAIAQETRDRDSDITANVVLPSVIDTPKNRQDMGSENAWQWVAPESLAGVIVFLASPAAKDIRGAAIPVYGKA
ncbi:3-ketoacyl-(acyl-carrier-protein) reductase [Gloeomargarita lithophora Alchichica-D10]|uniref:3-ketoacyl-(Acyl-carrier-protein) reductase n=1 Tax=Gloeomargarita lithophora Alchichica-D10 TaxID=1188229 RepID=A0A1J0AA79_9CYAN|nr:3-oxoacyl-ACP reductase FabG [Gloeomargarita lithophora]APB32813.1 3-ketoacyl-(acyl-carrier-protein) reductase [Gloeomargarita lithophora Alchichica-D10]